MSQMFTPGASIPLTHDVIQQFKSQAQLFQKQYANCTKTFDSSPDIEYFIISTSFINHWKNLVSKIKEEAGPNPNLMLKLPPKYNTDLISGQILTFGEVQLRMDIQESIDFLIVNNDVMKIFKKFQGIMIARKAYFYGIQKMVERYPIKFQFAFISQSWLKLLEESSTSLVMNKGLAYKNQTVLDLIYRMVDYSLRDPRNRQQKNLNKTSAKVYVGRFQGSIQKYSESIREKIKAGATFLDHPGQQLRKDMIIGDLIIPAEGMPIMIIELEEDKLVYKPSLDIESEFHEFCEFCRKKKFLEFECKCKEVKYCSKECQQRDWRYHSRSCQNLMEEDNLEPEFKMLKNSRNGLVGLQNLGNTCYMNAALQCLIHTSLLTEYFKNKLYLDQINEENPIGSKGKLLKSFAKFIESVLVTTQDVVAPHKFKYTVGKAKQMFSGYEQHDSQQFLLFVLDTLHQDLNRVRQKPYTNFVENQGRPDYLVAKESWLTYLKRNQSYINDIMGGQYRSEVKCPDCLNISVTFDPFLIFSVPIPSKEEAKSINLYIFFSNYNRQTLKMTVSSKNNSVKELREDVVSKSKSSLQEMKLFILGFNGRIRKVEDNETVDQLINQKQFNECGQERQLFSLQMSQQQLQNYESKRMLVFKFRTLSGKTLTFKRPFFFQINQNKDLLGKALYDRVCKLLFPLANKPSAFSHHPQPQFTEEELKSKYIVFRQKVAQKQKFQINMVYGQPEEDTNRVAYPKSLPIEEDTHLFQILNQNNFEVEFEVVFSSEPNYSFNSFKSHEGGFGTSQYYNNYGQHKTGFDETYTLEECLAEMKMAETLVKGNEVFCSICCDFKLSEKKMQLFKASKCLVLQLRRFKQIGYEKSKNHAEIKYPQFLDLKDYILNDQLPEAYFAEGIQDSEKDFYFMPKYFKGFETNKSTKYRLYGVVNHSGSLTGGHYTAYGRHQEEWYEFDDSYTRKIEKKGWNCGSSAYLLFYERLDGDCEFKKQVTENVPEDVSKNLMQVE